MQAQSRGYVGDASGTTWPEAIAPSVTLRERELSDLDEVEAVG